jgi:hypothetical protein
MSIQHICDFYGVKLIFISWFIDLQLLANEINYGDILEKMNVLDGSVVNFIYKNKIQGIPNNGHYGSEEHKKIFDEYINPQLSNWILGRT